MQPVCCLPCVCLPSLVKGLRGTVEGCCGVCRPSRTAPANRAAVNHLAADCLPACESKEQQGKQASRAVMKQRERRARRKLDISLRKSTGLGWERRWVEGHLSLQGRRWLCHLHPAAIGQASPPCRPARKAPNVLPKGKEPSAAGLSHLAGMCACKALGCTNGSCWAIGHRA